RHARAAATVALDARHVPEILSLGMGSGPAAARQRLLDDVHGLRRLCCCRSARPPDARDRMCDDRLVRLAVPWTMAGVQTRRGRCGLAERRLEPRAHPPDHRRQPTPLLAPRSP